MQKDTETKKPRRGRAIGWLLALALLIGGPVLAIHQSWVRIPPNWAPWGDVELEAEPSWLARSQINSLAADPPSCLAALDRAEIDYRSVPDRPVNDAGCGLANGVTIRQSQIAYNNGVTATCPLVAALYWYERDLQAAAAQHLGSEIARIEHVGIYACRNVYGRSQGRISQHATANAIDIAGFRLKNGRTVSVLEDWGTDTPEAAFLTAARDRACRYFNTVLGPDYNAAHANHFHLDQGKSRICR
ncbi:extensin-like domain-containing protein [Oceanibaculum pacificum]|uniref:extensin-like domain-containing protein n=1 Tax=Oceanibaculum pacificum TaxID=580166 RepID=UPI000B0B8673|nr:extensin family protein [Oceanibaculum pacificum]